MHFLCFITERVKLRKSFIIRRTIGVNQVLGFLFPAAYVLVGASLLKSLMTWKIEVYRQHSVIHIFKKEYIMKIGIGGIFLNLIIIFLIIRFDCWDLQVRWVKEWSDTIKSKSEPRVLQIRIGLLTSCERQKYSKVFWKVMTIRCCV